MLSSVFWLSLVGVFFGIKWLAEGLWSLARVEVRHVHPAAAESARWRDDAALKEAA